MSDVRKIVDTFNVDAVNDIPEDEYAESMNPYLNSDVSGLVRGYQKTWINEDLINALSIFGNSLYDKTNPNGLSLKDIVKVLDLNTHVFKNAENIIINKSTAEQVRIIQDLLTTVPIVSSDIKEIVLIYHPPTPGIISTQVVKVVNPRTAVDVILGMQTFMDEWIRIIKLLLNNNNWSRFWQDPMYLQLGKIESFIDGVLTIEVYSEGMYEH